MPEFSEVGTLENALALLFMTLIIHFHKSASEFNETVADAVKIYTRPGNPWGNMALKINLRPRLVVHMSVMIVLHRIDSLPGDKELIT